MTLVDFETGQILSIAPDCPNCAAAVAQIKDVYLATEERVAALEQLLTEQARKNLALRNENRKLKEGTPDGRVAKAIGKYWLTRLGKKGNAKVKDKRLDAVIKRLRDGYDPSYIARAIDGAAEAASTSSSETERLALIAAMQEAMRRLPEEDRKAVKDTWRAGMASVVVYNDLELICRDETKLESFHDRAERVNAPTLVGPAWLAEFEGAKFEPKPPDAPF